MSDLIRRVDAIEALGEEPPVWYDGEDEIAERNQWRMDVDAIKAVPSAQPKRGEWRGEHKMIDMPGYEWYRCSECNFLSQSVVNYCPRCGADMRGVSDDRTRSD